MEKSLEILDAFFDDRGKIPAYRNEDHSFKWGKPASYRWIGTAQLEQVEYVIVEEVGHLPSLAEEVVLVATERVFYCPSVIWIEAIRVNGPLQKNANAVTPPLKAVGGNHKERQCPSQ